MAMNSYAEELNVIRELAHKVKVMDLLDPSSQTVLLVTELVEKCKRIPELEMIDFNPLTQIEAEA